MAQALKLADQPAKVLPAVMPVGKVLALRARDPFAEASERSRATAIAREIVVLALQGMMRGGMSQNNATALLLTRAQSGLLATHLAAALENTAKSGRAMPTRSTLCEWLAGYRKEGINALLPDHKGRVVESAAWWGPAIEYFNNPSKPDIAAVYRRLLEVDGFACAYEQVRAYLNSVPAMVGRNSPARLGKNLYRLTQKAYIRRSTQNALPGDIYVADGYRADVYLAHPVTGRLWRPELTVAMDLRSRVIVGWRADEHEGAYAVQNTWAETFARWGHVPVMLYIDNGSGYKNRLMDCERTGFYARAGVQQIIHAIPGNPNGKGWIERLFRTFRDDFIKLEWPRFYCGGDMAAEARNRVVREIKAGRLSPPSLAQFTDALNAWLERYHNRPHPEDKTVTRAQLWAELSPIPPVGNVTELKRQAVTLTVRRASLKHGKREYTHPDLHAWNGKKLTLEYDLMDNRVAVIRDPSGRWICDAYLVKTIDAVGTNRLDEQRQKRANNAIARLDKKASEARARAGQLVDADAVADGVLTNGEAARIKRDDQPLLLDLDFLE